MTHVRLGVRVGPVGSDTLDIGNHVHLIVNAKLDSFFGPNGKLVAEAWMRGLVAGQGMKIMPGGGPIAIYCERPGLRGWTIFTVIETSHCVIHVWDEPKPILAQFDMYTCGNLDSSKILQEFSLFGVREWNEKCFDRAYNLTHIGGLSLPV